MRIPEYQKKRLEELQDYPYYFAQGVYTPEDGVRVFAVWYQYGHGAPTCYSFGARDSIDAANHIKQTKHNPTILKVQELTWHKDQKCWGVPD